MAVCQVHHERKPPWPQRSEVSCLTTSPNREGEQKHSSQMNTLDNVRIEGEAVLFWCSMVPVSFWMIVSGSDLHAVTIMYNFKWILYCVLIAKCVIYEIGSMAPFQLWSAFEVPFSATTTISGHLRQVNSTEGRTVPQHISNKRYGRIFVLLWNMFHLKPIRGSSCDCQHCLAITQAKWVFLHWLMKRHYWSLMSSSPCLSVGCVYYNCCHSFPLKSTLFLGLACKGQFVFHWLTSAAIFWLKVPPCSEQLLHTIHIIM